jgi:hypothetical protein
MESSLNNNEIVLTYSLQEIRDKIALGRDLVYLFQNFYDNLEREVNLAIGEILKRYDRGDLHEMVYSSVKELAINGVKANIKNFLFKEHNIDRIDKDSLAQGIKKLHEILSDAEKMCEYDEKVRDLGYKVTLRIKHSAHRVIIMVSNTIAISPEEETRVREKFAEALKYDSIAEYYMNNLDDAEAEGAGLGITMIVLLLKSCGIDPHSFTVYRNKDKETVAKIEIPLDENYVSSREIYNKIIQ